MTTTPYACSAYCSSCGTHHALAAGPAKHAALDLIRQLDSEKRLDWHVSKGQADPSFTTDTLFGPARGKMFAAMICRRPNGSTITLKAFSGQYNGHWQIPGWAPPVFDVEAWHRVNTQSEKRIKKMGVEIQTLGPTTPQGQQMVSIRKQSSRQLMRKLHQLYRLHNFRSQCLPLAQIYGAQNGIPNGTADCCGPKLLNHAAQNGLYPLGLAEFYYGKENKQGNRQHGRFYPSCTDKCGPILGYMLCGLPPNLEKPEGSRSGVVDGLR